MALMHTRTRSPINARECVRFEYTCTHHRRYRFCLHLIQSAFFAIFFFFFELVFIISVLSSSLCYWHEFYIIHTRLIPDNKCVGAIDCFRVRCALSTLFQLNRYTDTPIGQRHHKQQSTNRLIVTKGNEMK